MSVKRKEHSAEFKAKVALEALRGRKTTNEIASEFQIHPNLVTKWKGQLHEQANTLFRPPTGGRTTKSRRRIAGATLPANRSAQSRIGFS